MHMIAENIIKVRQRMQVAAENVKRDATDIRLLLVSKTKPASAIKTAYHTGERHFGENYLQEALDKQTQLANLDIIWHFIGPIQSNKTRAIAEHFDWVHSVDRLKIARRLSDQRPTTLPPLKLCLQVNIDDEDSKAGVSLDELPLLVAEVSQLPNIHLRGLMAIPAKRADYDGQYRALQSLQQALQEINATQHLNLTELSMGMSGDLEAAIAAGSTCVRIGTDIFGARTPQT